MPHPRPLPSGLQNRAFTAAQLRVLGESRDRVRRKDIIGLGSGVYIGRKLAETLDDDVIYRLKAIALALDVPQARLSHVTAARLWGFPLPTRLQQEPQVHLAYRGQRRTVMQRNGVRAHVLSWAGTGTRLPSGAQISRPEEVFVELAPTLSLTDLVVLGDHLVRTPYRWAEQRTSAHVELGALQRFIQGRRFRGQAKARQALRTVRVGSDSPRETRFRLAVVRAGLPEPELQVPLNSLDPRSRRADAGYPTLKIAMQYDGATHFTAEAARRDLRRDNDFTAAGWSVLRISVDDDREGYRSSIRQLKALLAARPPLASH